MGDGTETVPPDPDPVTSAVTGFLRRHGAHTIEQIARRTGLDTEAVRSVVRKSPLIDYLERTRRWRIARSEE